MNKLRLHVGPVILAFIHAPMLELNLRRGMTYTDDGLLPFFTRPVSGLLRAAAVLSICSAVPASALIPTQKARRR